MQVDLQVEVPKGYELTGEYRIPSIGEYFLNSYNHPAVANCEFVSRWLILRKVDTWRDATLDDLKRVMDGETVECRWLSGSSGKWQYGYVLRGWNTSETNEKLWNLQAGGRGSFWYSNNCQVKE